MGIEVISNIELFSQKEQSDSSMNLRHMVASTVKTDKTLFNQGCTDRFFDLQSCSDF